MSSYVNIGDAPLETLRQLYAQVGEFGVAGIPINATSPTPETSRVVKAGPGVLYSVSMSNANAATRHCQLFNASSLPVNGTVPVFTFPVSTVTTQSATWTFPGRFFDIGIFVCGSTTQQTLTLGSADALFDAQYM